MRNTTPVEQISADGEISLPDLRAMVPERIAIEKTGCFAFKDAEAESIKIVNQEGQELFALSQKVVSFESKPLFLFLQVYVLGMNNGRAAAQQEAKAKIEKLTDLIKCVFG